MLRCSPLSSRGQFGDFLNGRGLSGEAVEVGTHRGEFAHYGIMHAWWGRRLWCVDPWRCLQGYEEQQGFLWDGAPGEPEDHFEAARALLRRHGDRVQLLRMTSAEAVDRFADASLDFVFIDGDHRKDFVRMDLTCWWAKVGPGGILAGHDFVQPGEAHSWAGEVQEAVLWFADRAVGGPLDVQLIVEEGGLPWSYYFVKPGG